MKRRDFIAGTAIGATALALNGCHRAEEKTEEGISVNRGKKVTLKLATSWPAHFPIMGTGVD
ncbi:MAG: C4-dicarboxylate ABC transporter, partial [Sulfurovum sp.]|nr:C4-dicarboxylate ABC transporter [Sulfurovum sp.]